MATQEKEIILVQYDCYSIGSVASWRAQRRLFHIEKMETRCCKIELDVRGLDVGFRDVPVIVPRGGYILGMLAEEVEKEENKNLIKKLLSAGATPCQDVTIWACGHLAWLYLSGIVKEHESRKMAKPAYVSHN
jgi:hypothetical protein